MAEASSRTAIPDGSPGTPTTPPDSSALAGSGRNLPIDAMRGVAIVLMAMDHCALLSKISVVAETYAGRPAELPATPWFLLGLLTNFSAPLFWFLAGTSVALLAARERNRSGSIAPAVRYLLVRAGVLVLLDVLLMPLLWGDWLHLRWAYAFDLFSSLGVSLLLATALLPLPAWLSGAVAIALAIAYPALFAQRHDAIGGMPLAARLWVGYGAGAGARVTFPVLGWFPVLAAGLAVGRAMADGRWGRTRDWALAGLGLVAAAVLAKAAGFGDLPSFPQVGGWRGAVLMSKGPPGFDYLAFNLGGALLLTSALWRPGIRFGARPVRWLVVFGQASLFCFAAHLVVYRVLGRGLHHVIHHAEVVRYALALPIGLALLLPMARAFRRAKERHRRSVLRYL